MALSSCKKDDAPVIDEAWKAENEKAFSDLTFKSEYSRIMSPSNKGYIYYKVLKTGTGTQPIYYTSTVQAYYTGWYINGTVFDTAEPPYQTPRSFAVNGVVEGWMTALYNMRVGDRWEIWVPQELGYGPSGLIDTNTSAIIIRPYATLKFEVEVVKVTGIEE
jgi:peptidylprolyl isomerase/FKBP-type peptidyl-prolyl cis-trans isomerase FklB